MSLKSMIPSKSQFDQKPDQSTDWKQVVLEIIVKILTLGFYHIEKHKKQ